MNDQEFKDLKRRFDAVIAQARSVVEDARRLRMERRSASAATTTGAPVPEGSRTVAAGDGPASADAVPVEEAALPMRDAADNGPADEPPGAPCGAKAV